MNKFLTIICALSDAVDNSRSSEMDKRLLQAADPVLLNMKLMASPYSGEPQ